MSTNASCEYYKEEIIKRNNNRGNSLLPSGSLITTTCTHPSAPPENSITACECDIEENIFCPYKK